MNSNPELKNDWLANKLGGTPARVPYEFSERANLVQSQWMVGYDEQEIAVFFQVTEFEVQQDLKYVHMNMTPRQVIAMNADRDRIRIYRKNSSHYSRLLEESLTRTADSWIASGISPVGAMKEYRQAVGMEEKPGGIAISLVKNTANINSPSGGVHPANLGGHGNPRSFEDLLRAIIKADPSCGLQPVIDVDAQDALPIAAESEESNEGVSKNSDETSDDSERDAQYE
jgi:hypothetical protein